MPRLDRLSELSRNTLLTHPTLQYDTAPFTRPTRPLAQSRVALVTTAGLHLRGDRPFGPGDQTFRVIPTDAPASDIVNSHVSIGWDRSGFIRDLNLVLPRDRVREMVDRGEIGSLAPRVFTFMGAQRKYDGLLERSGPEVARLLREDGVDVVLLTGT